MSKARMYGETRKPMTKPDGGKARRKAVHKICKIVETKLPDTPEGRDAQKIVDAFDAAFVRQPRPSWMQQVDRNFKSNQ